MPKDHWSRTPNMRKFLDAARPQPDNGLSSQMRAFNLDEDGEAYLKKDDKQKNE